MEFLGYIPCQSFPNNVNALEGWEILAGEILLSDGGNVIGSDFDHPNLSQN